MKYWREGWENNCTKQPVTAMEWINMRLNLVMLNAQELIDSEIRTILIGSTWRLHYEHTWSGLNFGLPCYCESHNPQVFLTRVVPLTTIYIFEDINWPAKQLAWCFRRPKLEMLKNSFKVSMIILVDIKCIFDCRVPSFFEQPCPWVEVLSVLKPKEFVDNKSETLFGIASHFRTNIECSHRGSNFNF